MGNRVFQYFLKWVERELGRNWIDDHIHCSLALGAPYLGAPKVNLFLVFSLCCNCLTIVVAIL